MESRHLLSGQGFVQGTVYYDANHNQLQDPGEALAGATISLLSQNELTSFGSPVTTGPRRFLHVHRFVGRDLSCQADDDAYWIHC